MGSTTIGKIKGYIQSEDILNFIRQKYDTCAISDVRNSTMYPLAQCNGKYAINPHSDSKESRYVISGFIYFDYNGEQRSLFYYYDSINSFENFDYYEELGLADMVKSETTRISCGLWSEGTKIIKEIISHFGGGWIDEDDCDDKPYYPVILNPDGSIKPIKYVTMNEVYEKFGCVVIIRDNL